MQAARVRIRVRARVRVRVRAKAGEHLHALLIGVYLRNGLKRVRVGVGVRGTGYMMQGVEPDC